MKKLTEKFVSTFCALTFMATCLAFILYGMGGIGIVCLKRLGVF